MDLWLCSVIFFFLKRRVIMWQDGREGKGRLMTAIAKQRKTGVGECYLETREGSPHPKG
jgi:hypothetical protein